MSKLTEAYIRQTNKKAKKIENTCFYYADMGNCYSYVTLSAEVDDKHYKKQLEMEEFFEWIGGNILKITLDEQLVKKSIVNMDKNTEYKCDHCGTKNPEVFLNTRLTKCCAVTERKKGTYAVEDESGKKYYALGKTFKI
jgi:hypothetical protein